MIKQLLLRLLPHSWQHSLKKMYFPSVLKNVTDKDWPYARIIQHLIDNGDRVADIGANIGYVTSLLSGYVGPQGQVYSFEPVPETYDLLSHSLKKLQLDNVEAFCFGLSSASGQAAMEVPHFADGGENFYQSHIIETPPDTPIDAQTSDGNRAIQVELRCLDEVLSHSLDKIAFMKIDVEGHEFNVLDGGRQLLSASKPALLIEVSGLPDASDSPARKVFDLLESFGYVAWMQRGDTIHKRIAGETAVDYFFLMDAHIERLSKAGAVTR